MQMKEMTKMCPNLFNRLKTDRKRKAQKDFKKF